MHLLYLKPTVKSNEYVDIPGCIISKHIHTHTLEEKPSGISVVASEVYVRFYEDGQSKATEFL
jgi:hypothetical protein